MQPQVIRRKRHEHGAHAEVDPAGGIEIAHARINEREAGLTFAPGFKVTLLKSFSRRPSQLLAIFCDSMAGSLSNF